jgi:hypothetical protein
MSIIVILVKYIEQALMFHHVGEKVKLGSLYQKDELSCLKVISSELKQELDNDEVQNESNTRGKSVSTRDDDFALQNRRTKNSVFCDKRSLSSTEEDEKDYNVSIKSLKKKQSILYIDKSTRITLKYLLDKYFKKSDRSIDLDLLF